MPNVRLPGVGSVPRGGVIIGALVGVGGLAYLWYKHKQAAATPATPASGQYGYGYGGYGYNNPPFVPGGYSPYGYGGIYGYGMGEGYGVGSPYPPTPSIVPVTTNQQWAQAAETYLTNTGGYSPGTVAAALGIYISGSTLSADQQSTVEAAIAFEGYPPQSGANGYPPAMHTSQKTGQPGPTGLVTVPSVVGESIDNGGVTLSSEGLKIRVVIPPVRNHQYTYSIISQTPKSGSQVKKGSSVNVTAKKVGKV